MLSDLTKMRSYSLQQATSIALEVAVAWTTTVTIVAYRSVVPASGSFPAVVYALLQD